MCLFFFSQRHNVYFEVKDLAQAHFCWNSTWMLILHLLYANGEWNTLIWGRRNDQWTWLEFINPFSQLWKRSNSEELYQESKDFKPRSESTLQKSEQMPQDQLSIPSWSPRGDSLKADLPWFYLHSTLCNRLRMTGLKSLIEICTQIDSCRWEFQTE